MKRPDITAARSNRLNAGTHFPGITLTMLGGRTVRFPEKAGGRYRILFFYRGHW